MELETIQYAAEDGVATITFDRPDRLNAFNATMKQELLAVFDLTDADDAVRAVVVTGAGRGFSAGADLAGGGSTFERDPKQRDIAGVIALRIFDSRKPVIGAVNGPAVGMGATICLPMDFLVASENAKFGFAFARRGITPDGCSSWFLTRRVGISTAAHWMYSGSLFGAHEAVAAGLVRSLHQPAELLPAARRLAHEVSDHSAPISIAATRQLLWRMLGAPHPVLANHAESIGLAHSGGHRDANEGIAAFLEKRPAHFSGSVAKGLPDLFPGFRAPDYPDIYPGIDAEAEA
jgi:enoyl-CoA hydratase/carnithine racemase